MKVILLAPTPPPYGGIAEWTQRMLNTKLNNEWELDIVDEKVSDSRGTYTTKRNLWEEIRRCLRIWSDLNRKLKEPKVKVVHCCIPATTFAMMREYVSTIITKVHKRKFIIHFRCTVPNMVQGRIGKIVLKLLCNKCDEIMILNRQTEKYLKRLTHTKIILIPNFVANEELDNSNIFEVREKLKKVVYVGGVMSSKGCDDVVRIAKDFPEIQFEMIGKVDDSIKELVIELKVANILLPGTMPHKEVLKHLAIADMFIFLSHYEGEGFSNAMVEAMAMGLPCLVTDWAANKEMIENMGGYVVPVGSIKDVGKAIDNMRSLETRKIMSEWNKKKVRNYYSAKTVIGLYVKEYEKVCGR